MFAWFALFIACSSSPAHDGQAVRIVSLQPQITETLFAIGAADSVVGRSDYDAIPDEVQRLPSAGTALTPNVEAVVALRPSHIVIEQTHAARLDLLEPLATVEALPWHQVADLGPSIERLGALTGHPSEARALAKKMTDSLVAQPPSQGPRVLLVYASDDLGSGALWFVQRNSLHGAAMHAAGLINAVDHDVSGAASMPVERLIAVNPEWIIVLSTDAFMSPANAQRLETAFDRIEPLSAVAHKQVRVVASSGSHSTGPSLLDFVEQLRSTIPTPSAQRPQSP